MNNSSKGAALAGVLLLWAGPSGAKVMEDTVAVVNGAPVLLSEYQKELSSAVDFWSRAEPDAMRDPAMLKKLRETVLEQLVDRELMYQEGAKQKIKVRERDIENGINEIKLRFMKDEAGNELPESEGDAAFQRQLKSDGLGYEQFKDRLSKQIMARKLVESQVKPKVKPPEEGDMKAYFEKVRAYVVSGSTEPPKGMGDDESAAFRQFAQRVRGLSSERVRLSQILIRFSPRASANEKKRAKATILQIRKRVVSDDASFAEVARAESEDPQSAARGGDSGYVLRTMTPPQFEKAAFSLPLGEVSDPVETELGYHLIRVSEKRAAEKPEIATFKDDLKQFMMEAALQREIESFVKNLKAKAVIERNLPTLQ